MPSTGTVGPVQNGTVTLCWSSGESTNTPSAEPSTPIRYGRRLACGARRQTARSTTVSSGDRRRLLGEQRRRGQAGEQDRCGDGVHGIAYLNRTEAGSRASRSASPAKTNSTEPSLETACRETRSPGREPKHVRAGGRRRGDPAAHQPRQRTRPGAGPDHDGRPRLPAVAVQERLRETRRPPPARSGERAPRAVVPPLDVARMEPVVGGAAVGLDAVHEVEPVATGREAPLGPVDRLDVAAAVAGRHLRLAGQRLHRGHPGRHRRGQHDVRPAVVRDPERRRTAAVL